MNSRKSLHWRNLWRKIVFLHEGMHETTETEKMGRRTWRRMTLSGKHGWVAWLQLVVDLRELRVAPRLTSEKLCWLASPRLTCRGVFRHYLCAGATHFQEAPVFPLPVPSSSSWLSLAGFAPPTLPAPPPVHKKQQQSIVCTTLESSHAKTTR